MCQRGKQRGYIKVKGITKEILMAGIIINDSITDFVKNNMELYWPFPTEEHVIGLGDNVVFLGMYPTITGWLCASDSVQFAISFSVLTAEGIETRDYMLVDKRRSQANKLTLELFDKVAAITNLIVLVEVGQVEFVKEVGNMVTIKLKKGV